MADPHGRVFVVFLEIEHVDVAGPHDIRKPLVDLLERVLGPDDLVGVMTPEMSPASIAFGRRTQVIEEGLRVNWPWGRRNTVMVDDKEKEYDACFPPIKCGELSPSDLAKALIQRRHRIALAMLDDVQYFRELHGDPTRSNVTFYPIDPRGPVVFDSPVGLGPPPTLQQDRASLHARQNTLQELASATDGIALVNSNDLTGQVTRVAADLTSYYLIGYASTNTKLDGRFRTIRVRPRRPGIHVRARRGYRAATTTEVAAARAATEAPAPDTTSAIKTALNTLEASTRGGAARRAAGEPRLFHRGRTTGNRYQPTDARVLPRSERLRFEVDAGPDETLSAALLTRTGTRLDIPFPVSERAEGDRRVLVADLTLAPLGAGDYLVELTRARGTETTRVLVAVRVTQ